MNRRTLVSPLAALFLVLLLICSCTAVRIPPGERPEGEKPKGDPFSRVYAVPFKEFHPRLNQALQKYAGEKPGNSFQVTHLGNDQVIIRGFYQKEANQARLPIVITIKPAGPEKTHLEIKPPADQVATSDTSVSELFKILERETGFLPAE